MQTNTILTEKKVFDHNQLEMSYTYSLFFEVRQDGYARSVIRLDAMIMGDVRELDVEATGWQKCYQATYIYDMHLRFYHQKASRMTPFSIYRMYEKRLNIFRDIIIKVHNQVKEGSGISG